MLNVNKEDKDKMLCRFDLKKTFNNSWTKTNSDGRTGDSILLQNPGTEVTRLVLIAGQPIGKHFDGFCFTAYYKFIRPFPISQISLFELDYSTIAHCFRDFKFSVGLLNNYQVMPLSLILSLSLLGLSCCCRKLRIHPSFKNSKYLFIRYRGAFNRSRKGGKVPTSERLCL